MMSIAGIRNQSPVWQKIVHSQREPVFCIRCTIFLIQSWFLFLCVAAYWGITIHMRWSPLPLCWMLDWNVLKLVCFVNYNILGFNQQHMFERRCIKEKIRSISYCFASFRLLIYFSSCTKCCNNLTCEYNLVKHIQYLTLYQKIFIDLWVNDCLRSIFSRKLNRNGL